VVRLGKADSVLSKANEVIQVASGLPELSSCIIGQNNLSQGGRPMRKFLGEAS
jgi:hypothetical protein